MRSQAGPQSNRKSSTRLTPGLEEQFAYLQPESDVGARGTRLYHNHPALSVQKPNGNVIFKPLLFDLKPSPCYYNAHARLDQNGGKDKRGIIREIIGNIYF